MGLDSYSAFKTLVANYLKRGDLTTQIPDFIFLAEKGIEQQLRFSPNDTWTVSSQTTAGQDWVLAPVGMIEPIMFRLDSDPIRELEIVSLRELARLREVNETGIPRAMATIGLGNRGSITAMATADAGANTTITAGTHGLANGTRVQITGTTSYNGLWTISAVAPTTFKIAADFVANDATGTWQVAQESILFDEVTTTATAYTLFYRGRFQYLKDVVDDEGTTWLLDNYPNVLLYGTLLEAEPYIKNDQRTALWAARFTASLRDARIQQWRKRAGGGELRVRPDVPMP